jgi:putative peptidoglycan lipid II flippase
LSRLEKAAKSVFIIIFFGIGSRILGFIREALIAAKFGSGAETDTFFLALTATSLFTVMITKAINTTTIPVLSKVESLEGKDGKISHANNLLHITLLISLIITILAWIFAPALLKVLAYGFEGEQYRLAILMLRIGLFSIVFSAIVGVFRGYLQSEHRFTESAAADFPFNLVYIFFLFFLSGTFGIKGLMVASVIAVAAQILIQIPGLRKTGFKYKPLFDIKDKYVQHILTMVPPILLSVVIADVNKMVDRSLASTLVDGSISALNYANRIDTLVTGIFISAVVTVIFPIFAKEANMEKYDGLKKIVVKGLNVALIITIPATVGLITLANPIIKVAFQRGAFDATATYMTSGALVFYALGLIGTASRSILYRTFYALQDTKTPMITGIISVAINITLNFILIRYMAHKGLALATSVSATVSAGLVLYLLRKKIGAFGVSKLIECGLKALTASTVMGVVVYFLHIALHNALGIGFIREFTALFVTVGVGALLYFVIIYIMKVKEIEWIVNILKGKLGIGTKNNM